MPKHFPPANATVPQHVPRPTAGIVQPKPAGQMGVAWATMADSLIDGLRIVGMDLAAAREASRQLSKPIA